MDDALDHPALKRRKVTQASRVLARPFVSPLAASSRSSKTTVIKDADSSRIERASHDGEAEESVTDQSQPSSAWRKNQTSQPPSSSLSTHEDDHEQGQPYNRSIVASEQSQLKLIRQLERRIRTTRSEIDTLDRAASIQTSSSDERLQELIKKWRVTAQAAADELFPSVKQRLMNMGGVAAWRDTERVKFSYGQQQESADRTEVAEPDHELRQGDGHDQSGSEPASDKDLEDSDDNETFTLGMMLQSLNIDFHLIGYDAGSETWSCSAS